MWMWEGDPVAAATLKALGVSPIPLAITDVLTSLQTNMIDTVYTNPLACVSLQWFTKVKYISTLKLTHATGAILVAKRVFQKLTPVQQKNVAELGRQYCRKLVLQAREDDRAALNIMKKNGLKQVNLDPEQVDKFKMACHNARKSLVGKLYSQEMLDKVEKALTEFRSTAKK